MRALMWRWAGTPWIRYERIALRRGEITLRPFVPGDVLSLVAIVQDPEIVRFSYLPPEWRTEPGARKYIDSLAPLAAAGRRIDLAVEDARSGSLVGHAALRGISWRHRQADVATWVAAEYRDRGIAGEALDLLSEWAFSELGMLRMRADPDLENVASQRMLERAGFSRGETVNTDDDRTVVIYTRTRESSAGR
jgi:RimJ/RimL family protein N-acetyltransferase